jgi:hypothetical protein
MHYISGTRKILLGEWGCLTPMNPYEPPTRATELPLHGWLDLALAITLIASVVIAVWLEIGSVT